MASLNGWNINKFGNLSNGEYHIVPIIGDYHSEYSYSCRLPNKTRKEFKSLHGAVTSINRLINNELKKGI